MGHRYGIEARRSDVHCALIPLRLVASLRQEPHLDAKGEPLAMRCLPA
jgi:hypothetical protein